MYAMNISLFLIEPNFNKVCYVYLGQIPIEHIEIDESLESFIKIITPLLKENKEYCTIIKPDVFGIWIICEFVFSGQLVMLCNWRV